MAPKDPSRKVATLLGLSLPDDAVALARLPHPRESTLPRVSAARLAELVELFQGLWLHLATRSTWRPTGSSLRTRTTPGGGTGGFWTVLRVIGTYYAYCLYRYATLAGPEAALALLQRTAPVASPDGVAASLEGKGSRLDALLMITECHLCASQLFIAAGLDQSGFRPGELLEQNDADLTAIRAIERLHEHAISAEGELCALANELLALAMEFRRNTVRERSAHQRELLRSSAALVSVRELVLLGSRHRLMAQKYGEKVIEREFERQVAAIFRTLGFIVLAAPPGKAAADLVCISREPRYCFLVDAKTSRDPYKLPKADRRAITDYVRDYRATPDPPDLEFMLIVGSQPAPTVPKAMERLGTEIGLPVRFCGAALLAMLQQSAAGPIPPGRFKRAVCGPNHVLDESILDEVKEALDHVYATYASVVGLTSVL